MKQILLIVIVIVTGHTLLHAQGSVVRTEVRTESRPFNDNLVVKDSTGAVLLKSDWKEMLSSGEYILRLEKPGDADGPRIITRMPPQIRETLLSRMPPPNESGFFTNGEKPEPFKAFALDGKRIDLKELTGKVVVLNFWFVGCPPCRQEIPELNKLVEAYANNPDVVFVAIALDGRADVKRFINSSPFNYRQIVNGRDVAGIYGVDRYPTNVVIDKAGVVRFNASGFAMNMPSWIKRTIDQSLTAGH